jgi:hypothetical protein
MSTSGPSVGDTVPPVTYGASAAQTVVLVETIVVTTVPSS